MIGSAFITHDGCLMNTMVESASLQKKRFWAIIAMIAIPLSGLSIDIYVPSLPAVTRYFQVDQALVQLTISIYMLGFGAGQFFAGSVVDSIGRKKPFVITMIIYIIVSFLIPFSGNIYELLALRLLQGLSVAFLSVPMRAVISDLFTGKEFLKMMNYMTLCWAIGPIIAPAIGGYLQHFFGWQSSFYFLTLYAILALVLGILFLPETIRQQKPFQAGKILTDFREIMTHWDYVGGVVCLGVLWSVVILFSIVGPFLIQNVLHYSAIEFGHMALLMGAAWFFGNITSRMMINVDFEKKIRFCLWAMLLNALIMLGIALAQGINLPDLLIQTFILIYLGGIVFPNYFARNVAWFPHNAAAANALTGAFMTIIASSTSAVGALLKSDSQVPLTIAFIVVILICIAVYHLTAGRKNTV